MKVMELRGVVGVLRNTAAHAAGVVGEDATHATAGDGCRVWADLSAVQAERIVGLLADEAGLHADRFAVLLDANIAPVAADVYENAVGDGLA